MSEQFQSPYPATHVNEKTHFSWPIVVAAIIVACAWGVNITQNAYLGETIKRLEMKQEAQTREINNLTLSLVNLCANVKGCKMVGR